jgi:hypothetical protein
MSAASFSRGMCRGVKTMIGAILMLSVVATGALIAFSGRDGMKD